MHLYKLSPTRAVAHYGKFKNYLYTGSSLTRAFQTKESEAFKKAQKAKRNDLIKNGNCWEENEYGVFVPPQTFKPADKSQPRIFDRLKLLESSVAVVRPRSLSTRSKYKIRDKIESLYNSSNGSKFTFLTLSFIADVDDKQAQKVLNNFLTVARRRLGKFLYIWVAERQQDTKNIHFHLISNVRFPIGEFNALWVLQQYNAGIVHPLYTIDEINEAYKDEQLYMSSKGKLITKLQTMLNPVDVKPIKGINGLSIYLTMYVTKNKDTFLCSCWHCCRTVSKLFTSQVVSKETFEEATQKQVNWSVNINTGEIYEAKTYVSDYAVVVNILNKEHFRKKLTDINKLNKWILEGMKPNGIPDVNILDYHTDWAKYNYSKTGAIWNGLN